MISEKTTLVISAHVADFVWWAENAAKALDVHDIQILKLALNPGDTPFDPEHEA